MFSEFGDGHDNPGTWGFGTADHNTTHLLLTADHLTWRSWSQMKRHLQCGEQQVSPSNIYSSATKYYSITTKYYSALQRTTPVLLCTTLYYSNFTLYYKVLLQSYSVLLRATKYYSVLQSTSPVLFRTTLYHKVLPIWNVFDIARSNRCHPPTSPKTVPATKSHCHDWSLSHMKRQMAYCHCTPFCVRLSYISTPLLSLCMHSYTLNEVFTWRRSDRVKRRRSERANSRRSERCTSQPKAFIHENWIKELDETRRIN